MRNTTLFRHLSPLDLHGILLREREAAPANTAESSREASQEIEAYLSVIACFAGGRLLCKRRGCGLLSATWNSVAGAGVRDDVMKENEERRVQ